MTPRGLLNTGGALCLAASVITGCGGMPAAPTTPSGTPVPALAVELGAPFAFVSTRDGAPAIYVAEAYGRRLTRLTAGTRPDWSSDGRIAYEYAGGARPAGVYVIDAAGGGDRYVGPGEDPSWSPDGRWIAASQSQGQEALWILDAHGIEAPRAIEPNIWKSPQERGWVWSQRALAPAWSRDGRDIAFSGCSGAGHPWDWGSVCDRLWTVSVIGDQTEVELDGVIVGTGGAAVAGTAPAWTPEGRLVFSAQVPGVGLRLHVLIDGLARPVQLPVGDRTRYDDYQITAQR